MNRSFVNPIVEATFDFIATQLSKTSGIRVMVVIGPLVGLSDLQTRIRHTLGDRVGEIVFEEDNEFTMFRGAVRIWAQTWTVRKTYRFKF
jgi:hypothetical protein